VTLENKLLAVTVLPEKGARTFTDGSGDLVWVLSRGILEFGHPPDHQPHGSSGLAAQTG